MKHIIPATLCACIALAPAAWADEAAVAPKPIWGTIFDNDFSQLPEWLKRTEIQLPLASSQKPAFSILTVQPIFSKNNSYVFNQSRLSYNGDDRLTGNIGFGYRYLSASEKIIYGINAFYDFEKPYDHSRAGLGLEFRMSAFEANANYYHALSGWKAAGTGFEEHALSGFDAEIGGQVPYVPWAWVFAKGYQYESEIADVDDITGAEYALRLRPSQNIEVESGYNSASGADDSTFVRLSYRVGFGETNTIRKKSMFSSVPFESGESMKGRVYDKIRRSNDITVQRRATGGGEGSGGTARVRVAVGS